MIKMMNTYVLFERTDAKEMTDGGLYIPEVAKKMTKTGVVRACCEGELTPGDQIIFNEYHAIAFRDNEQSDKTQWIMREEHVMGVVEIE